MEEEDKRTLYLIFCPEEELSKRIKISLCEDDGGQIFEPIKTEVEIKGDKKYLKQVYSCKTPKILKKRISLKCSIDKSKVYSSSQHKISHDRSNFLFGVSFGKNKDSPKDIIELTLEDQFSYFNLYVNEIQGNLKQIKKKSLIIDAISLLKKQQTYDLEFFCILFRESFMFDEVSELFKVFDFGKIVSKKTIEVEKYRKIIELFLKKKNKLQSFKEDKFESFLLYFYRYLEKDKFFEKIQKEPEKFIPIILKNTEFFKGLNTQDINILFSYIKNFDDIERVLKLSSNYSECIEVILNQKETILELYNETLNEVKNQNEEEEIEEEENSFKINLLNVYQSNGNDDIKETINAFSKLNDFITKNQDYNFIKYPIDIFNNYITLFEKKSVNPLFEMKKDLTSIYRINDNKTFYNRLKEAVQRTGIELIEKNKIKNSEVLDFLINSDFFQNHNQRENGTQIGKGFNLETLDEQFIKDFPSKNFKKSFDEKQYKEFLKTILSSIQSLKTFENCYQLFPLNNYHKDSAFIEQLLSAFEKLIKEDPAYQDETLLNIIKWILQFLLKRKQMQNHLFEIIEANIGTDKIIMLYKDILSTLGDTLDDKVTEHLVNYLTTFSIELEGNSLIGLVNNITKPKILEALFVDLQKRALTEDDMLSQEKTKGFQFFEDLLNGGYFKKDKKYLNQPKATNYFKITIRNITNLLNKFETLTIYSNDMRIYSKLENVLKERILEISNAVERKDGEKIYNSLKEAIKTYSLYDKSLTALVSYYSFFFYKTLKLKKEYTKHLENIRKVPFNELTIPEKKKRCENFVEQAKNVEIFNKLTESVFFNQIFQQFQFNIKFTEEQVRDAAKSKFEKLEDLLDEEKCKNIQIDYLLNLLKTFNSLDKLTLEFTFLKKYFKKENVDTSEIEVKLMMKSKVSRIQTQLEAIFFFIEKLVKTKTEYYTELKEGLSKKEPGTNQVIEDVILQLSSKYSARIEDSESPFFNIITTVYKCFGLFDFLNDKNEDGIRNLGEFVEEVDDAFLSPNDISDFLKVVLFMTDLKESTKDMNDKEFIQKFKEIINLEKYKNIEVYFNNVARNYSALKDLYTQTVNKDEFAKNKIKELIKSSVFTVVALSDSSQVTTTASYEKRTLGFEEVIELRDRVLLKKKGEGNEDFEEKAINFSKIITIIKSLIEVVTQLSNKGYTSDISVKIDIENNVPTVLLNDQQTTIDDAFNLLKTKLNELTHFQNESYQDSQFMTFVFGRKFNLIINYLKHKRGNIDYFLKYITNNKLENASEVIGNFKYISHKKDEFIETIENCKNFLNDCLNTKNIKITDVYKNAVVQGQKISSGIKGVLLSSQKFENELIKLSYYYTSNPPIPQTVMLCNETTTLEEITAFLYRAVLCTQKVVFFFIKIDELELNKRQFIINFLKDIKEKNDVAIKSVIIFSTFSKASDFYKQLVKDIIQKDGLIEFEKLGDINIPQKKNVEIISSNASGIGKSNYILNFAKESKLKYIYFPVGGEFTREDLAKRMLEINFNEKNLLVHLDLGDTKKNELMRDFLFNFLVLGIYTQNENTIYLNESMHILVEIPFGFFNFADKFNVLELFKTLVLKKESLLPIIVPNDITSNIQIVANYIKHLDELNAKTLIFKGISEVDEYEIKKHPKKYLKVEPLSQNEVISLLKQVKEFSMENVTYYQMNSFINALGVQLKMFTKSTYLSTDQLENIRKGKKENALKIIREFIVKYLIDVTSNMTKGAYSDLVNRQDITFKNYSYRFEEEKAEEQAKNFLSASNNKISFEKIITKTFLFFNEDGITISIICKDPKGSEDYKNFYALYNSGVIMKDKETDLIDYHKLSEEGYYEQIKKLLDLPNDENKRRMYKKMQLPSIKEAIGSYVFTEDNFVKTILILLRVRAQIPVILMGETGCGKTSLIRMISQLKRNRMETLNVHAGVGEEEITTFMEKNQLIGESFIGKEEEKFWVFLDEINTCNSMGLFAEMMTKHTILGKPIKKNVVFIAACNPYRVVKNIISVGLVREEKKVQNLVYTVNPLPHCLLNFVFDFGNLESEDEKRYISSMVSRAIKQIYQEKNEKHLNQLIEIASNTIFICQNEIRNKYDVSSVSLREIRRFVLFYEFFYKDLKKKHDNNIVYNNDKQNTEFEYSSLTEFQMGFQSIILCIYLCYFLRISDKSFRSELAETLSKQFNEDFLAVPLREQDFVASQVKLEKGIAKNRALLENLFSLYVCIIQKVPIFICGKPGCSKSLSVQLLYKTMRGESSDNAMFQNLPRLFMNSYQGSLTSTSKGVLKIFSKARKIVKDEEASKNVISMVYFDEMGLAEISKNNPLKVIHSQLEYDENKDKVAFVGISNWSLDASKMNRGIYLSIPEPDEEDLEETAKTIAKSYDYNLAIEYSHLFESLAKTYFAYRDTMKKQLYFSDFHGSRDFYHLIKCAAKMLISGGQPIDKKRLDEIGFISLMRNFGGLSSNNLNSVKEITNIYKKITGNIVGSEPTYDVMQCIKDNILDINSRYLLAFSDPSISSFLSTSIIEGLGLGDKLEFYIGSKFEADMREEFYCVKIINKIQSCMEQGKILVLKDLDIIYPSLYDLFNQNFTVVSGKNFARIALGTTNNSMSYVKEGFRCVVLVDDKQIKAQDPPFLNRFEKHTVSFENLLSSSNIKVCKKIEKLLLSLTIPSKSTQKPLIDLPSQLLFCKIEDGKCKKIEEIQGLIYNLTKGEKLKDDDIIYKVLEKIVPTFTQDIISFLKISSLEKTQPKIAGIIRDIYKKESHQNLLSYLKTTNNFNSIVYTFSSVLESLEIEGSFSNDNLKIQITKSSFKSILISDIRSEDEIEKEIREFYNKDEYNVCLIKFNISDCIHLSHIKFFIENIEKEIGKKGKMIVFMIHMVRLLAKEKLTEKEKFAMSLSDKELISLLSNYKQIFIDNIAETGNNVNEIVGLSNETLIKQKSFIDTTQIIKENVYEACSLILFENLNELKGIVAENFNKNLVEMLLGADSFLLTLEKIINNFIGKEELLLATFISKSDGILNSRQDSFISLFKKYVIFVYLQFFKKLIFTLESTSFLSSYLMSPIAHEKVIEHLVNDYLSKVALKKVKISDRQQSNRVEIIFGLYFPLSRLSFKKLLEYVNEVAKELFEIENNLRDSEEEDEKEIQRLKNEYYAVEKQKINNVLNEMTKQEYLKYLMDEYLRGNIDSEFVNYLINDFLLIFLSKRFKVDLTDLQNFVLLIVSKKYKIVEQDPFRNFSRIILWVTSNANPIYSLCEIFIKLSKYIPNFYHNIEEIITQESVIIEESKRNPELRRKMNFPFSVSLEALLKCVLEENSLIDFDNEVSYEYINEIRALIQTAFKLELNYILFSKELYTLQSFINGYQILMKLGTRSAETIKKYISYIREEKKYRDEEDNTKYFEALYKQFDLLEQTLGELKDFPNFMINTYLLRFKQIKDETFRMKVLNSIIKNKKLLLKSRKILSLVLGVSLDIEIVEACEEEDDYFKEAVENFLGFTRDEEEGEEEEREENKNKFLQLINDKIKVDEEDVLNEVMLYFFECKFNNYFNYLENLREQAITDKILFGASIKYFEKSLSFIDEFENYKGPLKNIGFIYSVGYIKTYLNRYVNICFSFPKKVKDPTAISDLLTEKASNFKRMVQIYILKLFKNKMNSYEEMAKFDWKEHCISWSHAFSFEEKVNSTFDYLFIPNDYEEYLSLSKKFDKCLTENFSQESKEFSKKMSDPAFFEVFLDLAINKILSNLNQKDYVDKNEYTKFCSWVIQMFEKCPTFSPGTKAILSMFFKPGFYKDNLFKGLNNKPQEDFEMMLYTYKMVILATLSPKDSFFGSLFSKKMAEIINDSFVPGAEPNDDTIISSFYDVRNYLESTNNSSNGAYICGSCGSCYFIDPCGLPAKKSICLNCKQVIGGEKHKLEKKDDYRVYLNEEQRKEVMGRRYYHEIHSELLNEGFKKIVDEKINKEETGFKSVNFGFFRLKNKTVRGLDQISYRLLNLLMFSIFNFGSGCGLLSEEKSKAFVIKEKKGFFSSIKEDWKLLKEALDKMQISNIQIFLNSVLPEFGKLLLKTGDKMKTKEERKNFETQVTKIIDDAIKKYPIYSKDYLEKNKSLLKADITSLKSIINELNNPKEYNKNDYPYMKYFIVPSYVLEEEFKEKLNSLEEKKYQYYPVLSYYFDQSIDLTSLENILLINPFANYMLNRYSYRITRQEAKEKKIEQEIDFHESPRLKQMFEDFENGWKGLISQCNKYQCREEMRKYEVKENSEISYCLNDDGELGFGMYLASMYDNAIKWQNSFLTSIIKKVDQSGTLHHFVQSIDNPMFIQDATRNEIVSIKIEQLSDYTSIIDLITYFTYRDCFNENFEIDYSRYKILSYDMKGIEEELGNILLPGKRVFHNEQKFVAFGFEGYRGKRSVILTNFSRKCKQRKLTKEEKALIMKITDRFNFQTLMFSIQVVIFYLSKENFAAKTKLPQILEDLPSYISLCNECKELLSQLTNLTIETLVDIYECFEYKCYNSVLNNLNDDYRKSIKPEVQKVIQNFFKNEKGRLITKAILASGIRKFISRYLAGKRSDEDFNTDENIFILLQSKDDIWDIKVFEDARFSDEFEEITAEINVTSKESVELYEILGGDKELYE